MHRVSRLAVFAFVATVALAGCRKQPAAAGPGGAGGAMPPPEVGVVVLQPGEVGLVQEVSGRLAPYRSAEIRARVPGIVQRRLYVEGSDVGSGQPLFRIDPAPLEADASAAQAALARAQADAANARASADRARRLSPGKYISRSDLDNALAAERSANAAVQQARAAVQSARINLGYATVRAPISGRAGIAQVTEGALVGQGAATLLTTVDQIDPLYVEFSLGVNDLTELRKLSGGQAAGEVQVLLPDGSVFPQAARMDVAGDVVDPATGAVKLRAVLPNPQHQLLPGTFVTLRATLGQQRAAYRVPQVAVQRDAQGAYVLVVDAAGKAQRKAIAAERMQGSDWIVGDGGGLAPGDRVIVSGLQKVMQPGMPVQAVPAQAATSPAAAPQPQKQG